MDHKVLVRERATGQVIRAWPVDARELIASGEFEAGDDASERIALGEAAFPLGPRVTTTLGKMGQATPLPLTKPTTTTTIHVSESVGTTSESIGTILFEVPDVPTKAKPRTRTKRSAKPKGKK